MQTTSLCWRGSRLVVFVGGLIGGLTGCKDLTGSGQLPAGTPNPSIYNSASGAVGLRNAAVAGLQFALPHFVEESALLTDEVQDKQTSASAGVLLQTGGTVSDPLDERILPEGLAEGAVTTGAIGLTYGYLQQFRGTANLALHALATYDTAAADTAQQHQWRGELYAFVGYAEILLADQFCSGVPLSTLDFQGDFTYQPGSTTAQLYQDALGQLDSALVFGAANDSVINLARVLQGRAYLALGQYAVAKDDVTTVPTDFQYTVLVQWLSGTGNGLNDFGTLSDSEGGNGLPYRSSGDPRTADTVVCTPTGTVTFNAYCNYDTLTFPKKYQAGLSETFVPFPVVTGVEARLIEAEAELQPAGTPAGPWLTTLNTLRESISLSDTSDPGTAASRVALLFRERAFWLYMTGHRQGDLRRLLRQYSQYPAFVSQQLVYPTGLYTAPGTGRYGSDVTVPVPLSETANPDFHGCKDRNP